jgi:hypothetical protein
MPIGDAMTSREVHHALAGKRHTSSGDLVYVTRPNGVLVVTYPGLKSVSNFFLSEAGTACSDTSGNVFITNAQALPAYIYEFHHGGTTPVSKLSEPGIYLAENCSVDPSTGNLAVANGITISSGRGGVLIYKDARGSPKVYKNPHMQTAWDAAYDDSGNLFVAGSTAQQSGEPIFAELLKGSSKLTTISIPNVPCCNGGMQWDGQYFALQVNLTIYQILVTGSSGKVVNTIQLKDPGWYNLLRSEFWIDRQRSQVIIPVQRHNRHLGIFGYPEGGSWIKSSGHLRGHEAYLYSTTISVGS